MLDTKWEIQQQRSFRTNEQVPPAQQPLAPAEKKAEDSGGGSVDRFVQGASDWAGKLWSLIKPNNPATDNPHTVDYSAKSSF